MKALNPLLLFIVLSMSTAALYPFVLAADEPVEEVEDLQVVDTEDASTPPSWSVLQVIGRNHAAAVHLPIGFLFALCLVEGIRTASKKSSLDGCGLVLAGATVLSFIPAAISGLLRAEEVFSGKETPHLFFEHRNLMIAAGAIMLLALVLRIAKRNAFVGKVQIVYLLLLAGAVVITAIGAHHGGLLVYGEQFLPY